MSDRFMVSVVLPAYNEQANIVPVARELLPVLDRFPSYEVIFVDDGSVDGTLDGLRALSREHPAVCYVSFSRNFGHQQALRAGLDYARGDCVITMDCDLQHPPGLIETLVARWQEGYDVVYTVRSPDRRAATLLKRVTSSMFYAIMNLLTDIRLEPGVADFRLLDRRVVEIVRSLPEQPLFLRGIVAWVGFRQCAVPYTPRPRQRGTSKYSLRKMSRLALEGITSFSIRPLRIAAYLGGIVSALAFVYAAYAVTMKVFTNRTIEGWASVLAAVLLMGGVQLVMLGILGEYVGKLFMAQKCRPHYLVKEKSSALSPCRQERP